MPNVPEELDREQLKQNLKEEFDLTVGDAIEELTDKEKLLRVYGRQGVKYKKKGKMKNVLVFVNENILTRLDEFCHDNSVSRSGFIKLAIYKFARELGIAQEYESEYDRAIREQAMADANLQDPEKRNPYGSPWTTDEGDSSESD